VTTGRRWRLTDSALQFCHWPSEPEVAVFSPRANAIHLVTPAARRLLETLSTRPLSDDELAEYLEAASGLSPGEIHLWLPDVLRTLCDAELIEASPGP
jgi:PqqD family protein of HPr-rel-A system